MANVVGFGRVFIAYDLGCKVVSANRRDMSVETDQ